MRGPKSVLYIVEGIKDEKRLIERMWNRLSEGAPPHAYHYYGTNIHVLINALFENGTLDSDLDILKTLASREKDEDRKRILLNKYTDVFLVFDFDPQDNSTENDLSKIGELLRHFNDSSDSGKLYLNYPMIEAYRHISYLEDPEFYGKKISIEDCHRYKEIVGNESFLKEPSKCTAYMMRSITLMHLKKANLLINGNNKLPTVDEYDLWDNTCLFKIQCELFTNEGMIFVLNTSVFNMVDYSPSLFLPVEP